MGPSDINRVGGSQASAGLPGAKARARRALDTWAPSTEASVEAAIQDAFREGLKRAAELLDREGHMELARKVRVLGETKSAT